MLLGRKYKIESDSLNVTLFQKQTSKKTGNVYWRSIAYFSSPQNALKYLANQTAMQTELKELETVVKKLDEIYDLINRLELSSEVLQRCSGVENDLLGGEALYTGEN